jgi:hypothetical protein
MGEGGAYRDLAEGLRARLEALNEDVLTRLSRLPPEVWPRLPAVTSIALGAMHAELPRTAPDGIDEAARLEVLLERLRDALDRAIDEAEELEPQILALPDVAPPLAPAHRLDRLSRALFEASRTLQKLGWPGWAQLADEAVESFVTVVLRRFPEAHVERIAPNAARATVRTQGAPIAFLVEVPPPYRARFGSIDLRAATGIPLALPRVVLRPEVIAGLDVELGDPTFDGLFDVAASREDALTVLSPQVRAALIRLAWHDVPRVRIGDGRAEIAWTYEPTRAALDEATIVLVALRRIEVRARLLAW